MPVVVRPRGINAPLRRTPCARVVLGASSYDMTSRSLWFVVGVLISGLGSACGGGGSGIESSVGQRRRDERGQRRFQPSGQRRLDDHGQWRF